MIESRQYRLRRYAHAYADGGIKCVPCHWVRADGTCSCGKPEGKGHKIGKHPLTSHGINDATTDHKQIDAWWSRSPFANIAIVPGVIPGTDWEWIALDLDYGRRTRNGRDVFLDGPADLKRLEDEFGDPVNARIVQRSGSGAEHLILKVPRGTRLPGYLTNAIDVIHGGGKYIIAAPSNHVSGDEYEWKNPPRDGRDFVFRIGDALDAIDVAPDWLLDFDPHGHTPKGGLNGHSHSNGGDDLIRASRQRGTDLSRDEFEDALDLIPNDDVHYEKWFNVLLAIHAEGTAHDDLEWARKAAERWSRKSDKHDQDTFDFKWDSIYDSDSRALKSGKFILMLATVEGWKTPQKLAKDTVVARLNEKHALTNMSGKILVLNKPKKGRQPTFTTRSDFDNRYANDIIKTTVKLEKKEKDVFVPASKIWMQSVEREEYMGGVIFDPTNNHPHDTFNLWDGWSVKPDDSGSCQLFLDHIYNVICKRNNKNYNWLLDWMADIIQFPGRKGGTAVGLKGSKGAGKDIVGVYLGSLFEPNRVPISDPEHLTGRFNSHFSTALLLHMEEGFYAGSHKADSVLKHIVTADKIMVEYKNVNATPMETYFRIFMTSNAERLVNATSDERRYFILEVSEERKGDARYFKALRHEQKHGGSEALLYFLQGRDLSDFDVRNPPITEALVEQKEAGFTNVEKWWFEILTKGQLPGSSEEYWEGGPAKIERDHLREHYENWMKENRYQGDRFNSRVFGKWLHKLIPDLDDTRLGKRGDQSWYYVIPTRGECRDHIDARLGYPVSWDR